MSHSFVDQEFRQGRAGMMCLYSSVQDLKWKITRLGAGILLRLIYSYIWSLMICQLKTSWAAGLEHPHMSSPHGLGFPTIWWLDSKSGLPERKQGICLVWSCLQIFMTKPLSYILSLMQDPIHWYCLKPLPRGKRKEKTWTTSHCAVDHTQEHEERNKHTGVAFFGKYSLPHTAFPNRMCSHSNLLHLL